MTEVNLLSTTDSPRKSYLKKVNLEQVMKQVNMDLKLLALGQRPQQADKRLDTLLHIVNILNMGQPQWLED